MIALALALLFQGTAVQAGAPLDAAAINQAMSPGVNYGNVLEASPPEGWGQKARETDFALMAGAGFKGLRLPVRWSAKAAAQAPYTLDPAFDLQVQKLVYAAMRAGLYVVLNMHHYDELFAQPSLHRERFLAIWDQVAKRYAKHPRSLVFEILNEPHGAMNAKVWNGLHTEALQVIRRSNPDRVVMIGGADYNGVSALNELSLPFRDKNILFTFHHYQPFEFTHQGADWVNGSQAWLGRKYYGSRAEASLLEKDFKTVKQFIRKFGFPVCLGEYGAFSKADMESRVQWTAAMSALAKKYGYSRFYWEFKAGFGVWDEKAGKWNEALKNAVVQ